MDIALIGYGRMGHAIEKVALERQHRIVLKIDLDNLGDLHSDRLVQADLAIEFTGPKSAFDNIRAGLEAGIPVVSGSTGWMERMEEMKRFCLDHQGALLYASNFSVGVNLFFEINNRLAELMANHPDYEPSIKEVHHTGKKDAPSGTAITLAEQILLHLERKKSWINEHPRVAEELAIISERRDPEAGIHQVKYVSAIDDIEIIHTAHNREGFALGAVLAAEFLLGKKGIFTMKDLLSF